MKRFHDAKVAGLREVTVWGTGKPRREFLFIDDLADACIFVTKNYSGPIPLNIGVGDDVTVEDFARLVAEVVGFKGKLVFDHSYPDGTPRKLLDVSKLTAMGWQARTPLLEGLTQTYQWYLSNLGTTRAA